MVLRFAVAAPGRGHLAAWTAQRLARASMLSFGEKAGATTPRVVLHERQRGLWSARSFLDGTDKDHLRRLFRPRAGRDDDGSDRHVGRLILGPRGGDTRPDDASTRIPGLAWFNLGCCRSEGLRRLNGRASGCDIVSGSISPVVDGLVWCPLEAEADTETSNWLLGSLARILGCRLIKILLFPAVWDLVPTGPTKARDLRSIRRECQRLCGTALADRGVEVLTVPAARSGVDGDPEFWSRIAESLKMGAAYQRRGDDSSLEATA